MDVQVAAPAVVSSTRQCVCGGWTRYVVCQYCGTTDPAAVAAGMMSIRPLVQLTPEEAKARPPVPVQASGHASWGYDADSSGTVADVALPAFAAAALPPTTFAEAQFGSAPSAAAVFASTADGSGGYSAGPVGYTDPIPGWSAEPVAAPSSWSLPTETQQPTEAQQPMAAPVAPAEPPVATATPAPPVPSAAFTSAFSSPPPVVPTMPSAPTMPVMPTMRAGSAFTSAAELSPPAAPPQAFGQGPVAEVPTAPAPVEPVGYGQPVYQPAAEPSYGDQSGYAQPDPTLAEGAFAPPMDYAAAAAYPQPTYPAAPYDSTPAAHDAPTTQPGPVAGSQHLPPAVNAAPWPDPVLPSAEPEPVPDASPVAVRRQKSARKPLPRWALPAAGIAALVVAVAGFLTLHGGGSDSSSAPIPVHHVTHAPAAAGSSTVVHAKHP